MSAPILRGILALVALAAATPRPAEAHPHILVDARVKLLFDQRGDLTGIANAWD